jgi:hypothetical protein
MLRPEVEAFGGGAGGADAAPSPPPEATTRRLFASVDRALCKAARLSLFACLANFFEVAAS